MRLRKVYQSVWKGVMWVGVLFPSWTGGLILLVAVGDWQTLGRLYERLLLPSGPASHIVRELFNFRYLVDYAMVKQIN